MLTQRGNVERANSGDGEVVVVRDGEKKPVKCMCANEKIATANYLETLERHDLPLDTVYETCS